MKAVARAPAPVQSEERQLYCCTVMGQRIVSQGTCQAVVFRVTHPSQEGFLLGRDQRDWRCPKGCSGMGGA